MFPSISARTALALSFSTALMSWNASAAPFSYTTTGIITSGYDEGGFRKSADLGGTRYSMTTTLDPLAYAGQDVDMFGQYHHGYGKNSGTITHKVTIGGVTRTFVSDLARYNIGQVLIQASPHYHQFYQDTYFAAGFAHIETTSYLYSHSSQFLDGIGYGQHTTYLPLTGGAGEVNFYMRDGAGVTQFASLALTRFAMNDVPEPAPLALFALGLAALTLVRRKHA